MAGGRGKNGRGRSKGKRQREVSSENSISQQSSKDEDFVPPRVFPRFPTRIPRPRSAKSAAIRSLARNAITKTTRHSSKCNLERIAISYEQTISGNGDNVMPRVDNLISNCPVELSRSKSGDSRPIRNDSNTETLIVEKTITAASLDNWTDHISEPVVDQPVVPAAEVVDTQGPTNFIGTHSHILNRTNSSTTVDITELTKHFQDNYDIDEAESTPNPVLDDLRGYKVKPEFAPLLRRILNKHGDIAAQTGFKSPNTLSSYLQQLCSVCKHLERTKFLEIKQAELESMLANVSDFEREKLDVRWLRERVEYVYRAWTGYQKYCSLREELEKYDVTILSMEKKLDATKSQLCDMQRRRVDEERELEAKQAEAAPLRNMILDIRARVKTLVKGALVDGLY